MSRRKPGRGATGSHALVLPVRGCRNARCQSWFRPPVSQKMASNHADRIQPANIRVQSEGSDQYSFSDIKPAYFLNDDVVTVQFQTSNRYKRHFMCKNDAQHAELVHQATTPQQVQRCVTYQIDRQAALASAVPALVQAVTALPHTLVIAHS
jgi:hypothetical protein